MMRFDTVVLERRQAAREEEAEGAEGAISSEGAQGQRRARGSELLLLF
jgi:hypothetical protein